MLSDYIQAALRRAIHEILWDGMSYAEIPLFKAVVPAPEP